MKLCKKRSVYLMTTISAHLSFWTLAKNVHIRIYLG